MKTVIVIYDSQKQMEIGIKQMEAKGWNVESMTVIPAHYKFVKTCALGCLFLPLALLGKGGDSYSVKFVGDDTMDVPNKPIVDDGFDDLIKFVVMVTGGIAFLYLVITFFG